MHFHSPFSIETNGFIQFRFRDIPNQIGSLTNEMIDFFSQHHSIEYEFEINGNQLIETFHYHQLSGRISKYVFRNQLPPDKRTAFLSYIFDIYCVYRYGIVIEKKFNSEEEMFELMCSVLKKEKVPYYLKKANFSGSWFIRCRENENHIIRVWFSKEGEYYFFHTPQWHIGEYELEKKSYQKPYNAEQFDVLIEGFYKGLDSVRIKFLLKS